MKRASGFLGASGGGGGLAQAAAAGGQQLRQGEEVDSSQLDAITDAHAALMQLLAREAHQGHQDDDSKVEEGALSKQAPATLSAQMQALHQALIRGEDRALDIIPQLMPHLRAIDVEQAAQLEQLADEFQFVQAAEVLRSLQKIGSSDDRVEGIDEAAS